MKCRHCETELILTLIDLGSSPPSNAYLTKETLKAPERWFPLKVLVCQKCWLVQTEDYLGADYLFDSNYAYFSSVSISWLKHAESYISEMIERFSLTNKSYIIEVAANDGYLLQYAKEKQIPCLGIEPTSITAKAARDKGLDIIESFFGVKLANKLLADDRQADLMVANNVLAHVPNINDFISGFSILLRTHGVATFEFPHLLELVNNIQFDTIYHEHFSYLSFTAVHAIFEKNGLQVFDAQKIATHGGSLRVFAQRKGVGQNFINQSVSDLLNEEKFAGVSTKEFYLGFQNKADRIKNDLISFLIAAKKDNKIVIGYGAAAKGNTLINYAGVREDLLSAVVDKSHSKQGKYLPGSRIPIVSESILLEKKPDFILILPWNLSEEIKEQLSYAKTWKAQFVTFTPSFTIS